MTHYIFFEIGVFENQYHHYRVTIDVPEGGLEWIGVHQEDLRLRENKKAKCDFQSYNQK